MSWWNPIDDAKSVEKKASHLASDAIHTGKKLAEDAYHDTKTAVTKAVDVDKTIGRLGEVFTAAAINSGILTPLDGISQLTSGAVKKLTGYDLPSLDIDIPVDTKGLGIAGKIADIAGTGVGYIAPVMVTGGMTDAVAGLALAGKASEAAGETADIAGAAGKASDAIKASNAVKAEDVTKAGGQAADDASGGASRIEQFKNAKWKTAVDGAVTGFVFTPTKGQSSGLETRLKASAIDAATFGVMGAAARGATKTAEAAVGTELDSSVTLKDILDSKAAAEGPDATKPESPADSAVVKAAHLTYMHAAATVAGAGTYAEARSILDGRGFAEPGQLFDTIGQNFVKTASSQSVKQVGTLIPPPPPVEEPLLV